MAAKRPKRGTLLHRRPPQPGARAGVKKRGREGERADRYRSMFDRWVGVKRRESERERASVGRENAASLVDMCKARPLLPLYPSFQIPEARTPPAFLFKLP